MYVNLNTSVRVYDIIWQIKIDVKQRHSRTLSYSKLYIAFVMQERQIRGSQASGKFMLHLGNPR